MSDNGIGFRWVIVAIGGIILLVITIRIGLDPHGGAYRVTRWPSPDVDLAQGRAALIRYQCGACHVIPGIRDATGRVGPDLTDLHRQVYIGGVVVNSADAVADWIENPRSHSPATAMPDLDVTPDDARAMAAYLLQHGMAPAR